jgi:hypothetical protein
LGTTASRSSAGHRGGGHVVVVIAAFALLGFDGGEPHSEQLPAPTVLSPREDERFFCPGLILRTEWTPVDGASEYRVELKGGEGQNTRIWTGSSKSMHAVLVPVVPGLYSWSVAAVAEGVVGKSSEPRMLFCEASVPEEHLIAPAPGAVVQQTEAGKLRFSWRAAEQGTRYRLVISPTLPLRQPDARVYEVAEPTLDVSDLPQGQHFWGVYADGPVLRPLFLEPRALTVEQRAVSGKRSAKPKRVRH